MVKNERTVPKGVIGVLDEPSEGDVTWSRVSVRGWAIPPDRIRWFEVVLDKQPVARVSINSEPRPDVAAAHPLIPQAEAGGFASQIPCGYREGVRQLAVLARTVDGSLFELGKRKIANSRSVIASPPELYSIGLISRCNLSCAMCPAHADTSDFVTKGGVIDLELLEFALSGLEDFSLSIKRIGLTGWGEPFMSDDIFSAVHRCHEVCPNASISVTTNGTLFSDRLIDQILNSQITDIAVSLDAGSKSTYEQIRKGSDFERVVEGIRRLVQSRNRCNREVPRISTNFVLMRSNIHELPDYVRVAISTGVDRIGTVHVHGVYRSDKTEAIYAISGDQRNLPEEDYRTLIQEAQSIAERAKVEFYLPPLKPARPGSNCSFNARGFPIIDPSGDVYPCCILQAFGNEMETSVRPMGNIRYEKLSDIWKSGRYSRFREAFYIGDLPDSHCARCPKYYGL